MAFNFKNLTNFASNAWRLAQPFGGVTSYLMNQYVKPLPAPRITPASANGLQTNSYGSAIPGLTGDNGPVPYLNFGGGGTGGGAGGSSGGQINQATPDYNDEAARLQAEVDSLYGGGYDFLNQLQSSTEKMLPDLLTQAAAPYQAQLPILEQQRNEGISANRDIQEAEKSREANALASARSLFSELTQANRQRFGGAGNSSAGQFSADILGKQLMQNFGNIQNTAGTNIRNLMTQAQNIESNYQKQVASLTQAIEGAKAQARTAFQDRLDAINNSKFQLEQNKSVAKLEALKELRARIAQIEDSATAYSRQLELLKSQSTAPIQQALQSLGNTTSQTVAMQGLPAPVYSTPEGPAQGSSQSIFGFLNPKKGYEDMGYNYYGA